AHHPPSRRPGVGRGRAQSRRNLLFHARKRGTAMIETSLEILLVEDNPNDVELTLHAFKKNHLSNRIHIARDGAEALDFLFCTGAYADRAPNHCLKVVLLDLNLPKTDGLEVLRRIKSDPRTQTLPVVMLTSSRQERDIIQSYQLGVNS